MSDIFDSSFFTGNRLRLRQAVAADVPIIITANGLLQRTADSSFPFQQDSNFWYLTGITQPDITLVMLATDTYLIVPARSTSREAFDGTIDTSELTRISGIPHCLDEDNGWEQLAQDIEAKNKFYTPQASPIYVEPYGLYPNPSRYYLAERLQSLFPNAVATDIRQELTSLRMFKQPAELLALQQAIDVTIDSLLLVTEPKRFATYTNEYEFEADISREFRFHGASGHAFAPIVAGGKRACTLHNVSNEASLKTNELVVVDVGAEVSHYAADITRTRCYGTPSPRQQQVYDAVLNVQTYALGLLKPGALLKEYEQAVATYMSKTLQSLGLITSTDSETIEHEAIRTYFPHATSHFLGLDVHDVGDYNRPLAAGMVLTCEPGIYIPEESIGVRIEDDVLITETGNTVLSDRLPRQLT